MYIYTDIYIFVHMSFLASAASHGTFKTLGPGAGPPISFTWPATEESSWAAWKRSGVPEDHARRLQVYTYCILIYICIHVSVYLLVCIYLYTCVCMCMYMERDICVCIYTYVSSYFSSGSTYVYLHICQHASLFVCIHIYIHTHILRVRGLKYMHRTFFGLFEAPGFHNTAWHLRLRVSNPEGPSTHPGIQSHVSSCANTAHDSRCQKNDPTSC